MIFVSKQSQLKRRSPPRGWGLYGEVQVNKFKHVWRKCLCIMRGGGTLAGGRLVREEAVYMYREVQVNEFEYVWGGVPVSSCRNINGF